MNILRIVFELFVLYLIYKLVFDLIIPIYQTTKQVKQKVNEMNKTSQDEVNQPFNKTTKPSATSKKKDDYIDFEEVK